MVIHKHRLTAREDQREVNNLPKLPEPQQQGRMLVIDEASSRKGSFMTKTVLASELFDKNSVDQFSKYLNEKINAPYVYSMPDYNVFGKNKPVIRVKISVTNKKNRWNSDIEEDASYFEMLLKNDGWLDLLVGDHGDDLVKFNKVKVNNIQDVVSKINRHIDNVVLYLRTNEENDKTVRISRECLSEELIKIAKIIIGDNTGLDLSEFDDIVKQVKKRDFPVLGFISLGGDIVMHLDVEPWNRFDCTWNLVVRNKNTKRVLWSSDSQGSWQEFSALREKLISRVKID